MNLRELAGRVGDVMVGRGWSEWSGLARCWLAAHCSFGVADLPSTGASLSVAAGKKAEAAVLEDADADLEKRLKNLRKD